MLKIAVFRPLEQASNYYFFSKRKNFTKLWSYAKFFLKFCKIIKKNPLFEKGQHEMLFLKLEMAAFLVFKTNFNPLVFLEKRKFYKMLNNLFIYCNWTL